MPHLSKNKLNNKVQVELEQNLAEVINDSSFSNRKKVFNELFTRTEKLMIAKRLGIIFMFSQNKLPYEVSQTLKISPSTAARYQYLMENGYLTNTEKWVRHQNKIAPFFKLLMDLTSIVVKPKSLNKFIRDDL